MVIHYKYRELEDRTYQFALATRAFCQSLSTTYLNADDVKQLIRSSGSVGANYIEANESLGKGDFAMRIRICKKRGKRKYLLAAVITNSD